MLEPSKHSVNLTPVGHSGPRLRPHQQRVVAESDELSTRLAALKTFIDSDRFESVDTAEQGRLQRQKLIMVEYLAVLNERVAAFV
jgi:hypothetical protein